MEIDTATRERKLIGHWLIEREPDEDYAVYAERVCEEAERLTFNLAAVEGIRPPWKRVSPWPVIQAGFIAGALAATLRARVVDPGKMVRLDDEDVPEALWGASESKGTGKLRHCRSAWAVAWAASEALR